MTHLAHALLDDGAEVPAVRERMPAGLTARRVKLAHLMVDEGMSRRDAAARLEMTDRASRYAFADGRFLAFYRRLLAGLREAEKPKSVHRLAQLRDQDVSKKVSLEASKALLHEPVANTFNLGVNITTVKAGYIIDVSKHAQAARRLLAANGSGAAVGGIDRVADDDDHHPG